MTTDDSAPTPPVDLGPPPAKTLPLPRRTRQPVVHDPATFRRSSAYAPLSPGRIRAQVRRYFFLLWGSGPRMLEMMYWPFVQMLLWGFITLFLVGQTDYVAQAFGVLLSGVLLWDVLFRSQLGVAISFLEEMWSRNLGHMFVSPLRPHEMVVGLTTMSLMRTLLGIIPATFLAAWIFDFSVYTMGWPIGGFFLNLAVMGWAVGLAVCGVILRHGLGAESLAWVVGFGIAPITGIYYPVDVMPEWLQTVAWTLPSTHVFTGMRAILVDGVYRPELMVSAIGLNLVWLAAGTGIFLWYFEKARESGRLLQVGE